MSANNQKPAADADAGAMATYRLFGLSVASEIPLPDLPEIPAPGGTDVIIRRGAVAAAADPEPIGLYQPGETAILNIPDVGRYRIRDGGEIIVDPAADASDRNVRLFLLGSAFGAILHQRGALPLHANVIEIDGQAVAFMGHSGAGKSTMAAWFHDRGHAILGDDVCVVADGADGLPLAHFGLPRLRLWRDALELSGRTVTDYDLSFDDMDKYDVPTSREPSTGPVPLAAIYLLGVAEEGEAPQIRRLAGVEAVDALLANTYRGTYLKIMGGTSRHLKQCLTLIGQVPVFRVDRRWGHELFDAEATWMEKHAREILERRPGAAPHAPS
jgi:hypothetical protein